LLWGVLPLYLMLVREVPAVEVLAHRVAWAVPFGALIIAARHQWSEVRRALTHRLMLPLLVTSAMLIAVNWFVYIWAVQNAEVFQASLGYYINPLVFIAVGMVFFGERLRRLQQLAVALAVVGVAVLAISGGQFPLLSLALAVSFTSYSVIRRKVVIGAMPGLFVETLVLVPIALAWLWITAAAGEAYFFDTTNTMRMLIALAGPVTVVPLLFFAVAARRLPMATIGFMQFLAPSIQFVIGYLSGEVLTIPHMICFGFIWAAVLAFSVDAIRISRRRPLPVAQPTK